MNKKIIFLVTSGIGCLAIVGLTYSAQVFYPIIAGNKALKCIENKDYDNARDIARRCLKHEPNYASVRLAVTSSFLQPIGMAFVDNDYEKAIAIANSWLESSCSKDAYPLYYMGRAYERMLDNAKAQQCYVEAFRKYSEYPSSQTLPLQSLCFALSDVMSASGKSDGYSDVIHDIWPGQRSSIRGRCQETKESLR